MAETVLAVVAHADDEALGCAGTLLKHVQSGDSVHLVVMTDGVSARGKSDFEAKKREMMLKKASQIIGVTSLSHLDFPDNRMDTIPLLEVVQELEKLADAISPTIVYTHHFGDLNVDHRITHQAVMTAFRPVPSASVKDIYSFFVLSASDWTNPIDRPFFPNVFVDISAVEDKKREVLNVYSSELRDYPHVRSSKNIDANQIAVGARVGLECAEQFFLVRSIR